MQTLTQLVTEYQDSTKDTSTTNKNRGIRRMNERQRTVTAKGNFWWQEKEFPMLTVASQQAYQKPVTCDKITSIRVNSGNRDIVLKEIVSAATFDEYNVDGNTVTSDLPIYWHERDGKILLFPVPSSNNLAMTVLGTQRTRDMSLEDYTTGTIAVVAGDQTVTGTTTSWTSTIKPGAMIFIDGIPYEVLSLTDATHLELVKPYEGTTASGLAYKIGDVPALPEPFHDLLWMDACMYYDFKRENTRLRDIKVLRDEREEELKVYSESKSTRNIISKRRMKIRSPNDYPQNIG
jgi:hypothetical protein